MEPTANTSTTERPWWFGRALFFLIVMSPVFLFRIVAPDVGIITIVLTTFTSYLLLFAWPIFLAALFGKQRNFVLWAGTLAIGHLYFLEPWTLFRETPPPSNAPRFTIASANVLMVNRTLDGITRELEEAHSDIVLIQELSPRWEQLFDSEHFRARFPYRVHIARDDSFGIGIYAKVPLIQPTIAYLEELPWIRTKIEVQGTLIEFWNVHSLPPRIPSYVPGWRNMMQYFVTRARSHRGNLVFGGDLNTTTHSGWYRALGRAGLRGAHEACGRGHATTWPNGLFPLPPIRLDHLLLSRNISCVSIREGVGQGSDHRTVFATLALTPASTQ